MKPFLFPPAPQASVAVAGESGRFPVHRIYCVGRNFAEHAKEMGAEVPRGSPVFFMKPADAVHDGQDVPYPTMTRDLHHEVELVVAIGRDAAGEIVAADALDFVFGYGVGLDLTRRDLQAQAKDRRLPWDTAKGFDHSAPLSEVLPVARSGHDFGRELQLQVNGQLRQESRLDEMVFGVAEIIHELSRLYALRAGDLVFMGTPAGVAALQPGDSFTASIEGWVALSGRLRP